MPRPRSLTSRAREVCVRLAEEYPGAAADLCALRHDDPFELLVATILSAQSTDERVNLVTPELLAAFGSPEALAGAPLERVEELIYSTGFFRAKARSLVGMAGAVAERFGGRVPTEVEELTTLPGVGRKTANVVRSVAFGLPGFPVDTHVGRLVRRLGLSAQTDPDKVEAEVTALLPPDEWGALSLRLILHGRRVCLARTPRCAQCLLADICPSAQLPVVPTGRRTPGGAGRKAASGNVRPARTRQEQGAGSPARRRTGSGGTPGSRSTRSSRSGPTT